MPAKLSSNEGNIFGFAGLYLPQTQPAGARIGVFSNANYWSGVAGEGYDFQNGRTFIIKFWRSGNANNQTLWAFNTAATGWFLIHGSSRNLLLFWRGGGGGSVTITPNLYFGLNTLVLTQRLDGSLRWSINGGPATTLAAPGVYTAAGVTGIHAVGKNQGEATFAATQSSVLAHAVIDKPTDVTDAELVRWSGSTNTLDRWHVHPEVSGHANLTVFYNWENWDGASATFAGAGSAPFTLTRTGTGGGKTVMPSYLRYRIPRTAFFDNGYWRDVGGGRIRHSLFADAQFVSSAIDVTNGPAGLVVDLFTTQSGIVANSNAGLRVSGTNLAANNVGVEPDVFNMLRAIDCPGIPAGAGKTFIVTDGLQSEVGGDINNINGVYAQAVRVPASTPLVWSVKTIPANVVVNMSDSLFGEVLGITDVAGVKGPPYQAWPMLERVNWSASRRVVCEGWGVATWAERINTAQKRADTITQLLRTANATVSNWFWFALGTNDYGLNTYPSLVTFEADLVAFGNALAAVGLPDFMAWFVGPTTRTGEGTPNGSGFTLPNFRTAISNAVTTMANVDIAYVDSAGYVSAGNRPDGLHFNPAGHIEYEAAMRLVLGY